MRRRFELQAAYLLSSRPYRETSALIEVLTDAQGRVGLVARGVRGTRARLSGVLQPFTPLMLSWTQGGELGSLTAAEAQAPPPALTGERVLYGWYLNELLLRLLHRHDPHPSLFAAYAQALQGLDGDALAAQCALRRFEKRLLAAIGYALDLPAGLHADRWYRADDRNTLHAASPGEAGALPGDSLIALRDDALRDARQVQDARRLLGAALARQLGDAPLRTQTLLRQLRGTSGADAHGQ